MLSGLHVNRIAAPTRRTAILPRSSSRCLLAMLSVMGFSAHAGQAVDLTALSLEDLLKVPIVGASKYQQKQSEVAAAASIITRAEIKAFGWRTLGEALASLPGIHTTYDRSYAFLGTRGFGLPGDLTARVLININGLRINDPVYDGGPIENVFPLDLDLVDRIEFIPGPGGAVYGQNAMFGVVNVITRDGHDLDGAELSADWQQPQAASFGRASWGKRLDNDVDLLVSASGLHSNGQDHFFDFGSTGVSGMAVGMDQEQSQKLYARMAQGAWAVELIHGDRRKDDPTAAYFSDPLVPGQFNRDRYTLAQAQYQDSFANDTWQVLGRLFMGSYRYRNQLSYAGSAILSPAQGDWRGTEWRFLSTALPGHKLMLGFEAQDNLRTDQAVLDVANPANDIHLPGSGYRVGVYGQDEWRISDALSATLGLRIDKNDATGSQTSPRAALIWQATPATVLKALAGRAHRAPNVYEKNFDDGITQVRNLQLGGERIDTLELVLDHRLGTDLALRASAYQWHMNDLVTLGLDATGMLTQYQPGQTIKARGLELSADKTWPSGARLRGSLSWQNMAYLDGGALPNSPRLLGKLNYSRPLPLAGLHLGYELQYGSERLSLNGTQLGGYALSNLNISTQALAKGLELSLGIFNLFDKRF
ncbi:MAG: TonB-dependent receptor plug domain-containing protein, partial [Rhodoferax sp.]